MALPAAKTALELYSNSSPRTFTTGCVGLDSFLGGGVPTQGLTEICGESGAGKTQLCMQLLLTAQRSTRLHGLGGKTLFLSCEGQFPIRRLQEMAHHVAAAESNSETSAESIEARTKDLIGNVLITHIEDAEELMDVMTVTLPMELRRGLVKLVIVDSITAVCRGHYDNSISGLTERADVLISLAAYMKQMSHQYECAFVVVNQVSACFHMGQKACSDMATSYIPNGQEPPPEIPRVRKRQRREADVVKGEEEEEVEVEEVEEIEEEENDQGLSSVHRAWSVPLPKFTPALGVTWTTCVNTRVMLTRGNGSEDMDGFLRRRELRLLLSPIYTCGTMCHYNVNEKGVRRVVDEMMT